MATETKEYNCPAEGCEYSGTENSVAAHYSGTRKKPDHAGGYERAKQRMGSGTSTDDGSVGSSSGDDTDSGSGSGDTSGSGGSSGGSSSGGSHPTFGDGHEEPEQDSGGEDVELPCGCESFSTSDCPEPPFWVTCDTCGQSFKVTEL